MDIFDRCNGGGGGSTVTGSGGGASVRTSSNESGSGTSSGGSESSGGSSSRMQLTGASAPGAAASPESGVSPLTDAYTKMTSDILAERTLGDFVSEHPGELVRTGDFFSTPFQINVTRYFDRQTFHMIATKRISLISHFFFYFF